MVHGRLTGIILNAAYRVHSRLGPGLLEKPYRICMGVELARAGVRFDAERVFPIEYDGIIVEFGYRVDLLVEDSVIVEIKSVEHVLPVHEAQLLSYVRLSRRRVGLLINFNVAHLRDGVRRRVC